MLARVLRIGALRTAPSSSLSAACRALLPQPALGVAAGPSSRCASTLTAACRPLRAKLSPQQQKRWRPNPWGRREAPSKPPEPRGFFEPEAPKGAFWKAIAQYEAALEAAPILTKSVTSGALYGVGDCIAQAVSRRQAGTADAPFDMPRFMRAVIFGGVFYPGIAHLHYNFLEHLVVVRWATAKSMVPWYKMFIEQFVYWSYFTNAYYHAVLGALQGFSVQRVYDRVADTLWDTLKAQWAFWIPAQLINFRFVPVRHQLNFVLVVSLFWTTFLSLAFPPEPQPVVQKQNVVLAEEGRQRAGGPASVQ